MKNIILFFVPLYRFIAGIFFERKYLTGRFFEKGLGGWLWVWRSLWMQKIIGINRHIPWPVSSSIAISKPDNIFFDVDDLCNFQAFGTYFQNFSANIYIGKGTYIAPNVGIITSNHDPANPDFHMPGADVVIGQKCWIGMNSVILPGITLGDHTVVGAGSVVTKSFPQGSCIIVGNPARIIKQINPNDTYDEDKY